MQMPKIALTHGHLLALAAGWTEQKNLLLAGFRVTEVPIVFRDRSVGASKMSTRIALEAMWAVPLLRRSAPAAVAHARTGANAIEAPQDG